MFKKLIEFCLSHPWIVLIVTLASVCLAIHIGRKLPVDVFPELKVPRVVVQTEAGGLTAEEVEQFITIPVESAMNGIPGVKSVRSSSGGGLSFVWIDFDWNVDIYRARQSVAERLTTIRGQLPEGPEPEITPIVSVTGEIMLLAITAEEASTSMLDLRAVAEYDLRNQLMAIPGIGQVVVIGGRLPEYQINVAQAKLTALGITLPEIIESTRLSHTMASAGYLAHVQHQEIPLRQTARIETIDHLRKTYVRTAQGTTLQLGQVADVTIGGAPRRGSAGFDDKQAIVLSIQKAPGGNTLELTKKVDAVVHAFQGSRLPKGVNIHRDAYRQADFINLSIENGEGIVRDAAIIVIIVLGLTLLVTCGVLLALYKSRWGLRVRATVSNRTMANAIGINTSKTDRLTFAIGCGIAGVAGAAFTTIGSTGPTSGSLYIVDSFLVVTFGGAASLLGTVASAFGIAQTQSISEFFISGSMAKVLTLSLIVVILMIRPQGLFASKVRR